MPREFGEERRNPEAEQEKRKGKLPVFRTVPASHPDELALIHQPFNKDRQVQRRNKEIKFLMDVFDNVHWLEDALSEHELWGFIDHHLLTPIKVAAKNATQRAIHDRDNPKEDPKNKALFGEVQKVRNACAAATASSLNDPYNGEGVLTNLAHVIALAETSHLRNVAWREKKD